MSSAAPTPAPSAFQSGTPSQQRVQRRRRIDAVAAPQAGIVSRRQLMHQGLTRWEIEAELRASRWRAHGRQAIAVHAGPLTEEARRWVAVLEAGPRAVLDGVTALQAAGLSGFDDALRVSIPRGARVFGRPEANVRQTRRLRPEDGVTHGIPRVRPAVAAVRAALWARTDRQAALVLVMAVNQGLVSVEELLDAVAMVRRDRRRRFVRTVLGDIAGGVRAMSELDFADWCRRFHLPEPARQQVRQTRNGRIYLDVRWPAYGVVVEVDGIHHTAPAAVVSDAIRQNDVVLQEDLVLRIPLLGLRTQPEVFMSQVRDALIARGCPLPR
jgi:hypothetical protein